MHTDLDQYCYVYSSILKRRFTVSRTPVSADPFKMTISQLVSFTFPTILTNSNTVCILIVKSKQNLLSNQKH